jgi:hypothetical protein
VSIVKNLDIIKNYQHLFDKNLIITSGLGWNRIIQDMCLSIDFLIEEYEPKKYENFKINKIENKFGVLNVEYEHGDGHIKKIVDFAEKMSYYTCETCGDNGKIYCSTKWLHWSSYKTLCKEHAIKYYYYEIRHPKGKK